MRPKDNRWVAELPTGRIKYPRMPIAGEDLFVNDVVHSVGDAVYPVYDDSHVVYGIVAANGIKGQNVLVAAPFKA